MADFTPFSNAATGLRHHEMPVVKSMPAPRALLFVGNSLFFFNNGVHRMLRQLMAKTPGAPKFRTNMVAINGASLSWHDVESYFRPNAISSYKAAAARNAAICSAHGAQPIFYITWAYRNRPEMTELLADAIISAANENGAIAVPTGLAWALALEWDPNLPLYMEDNRHPTPAGTYLQACGIAASLFGVRATDIGTDNGIDPAVARVLRESAQETVDRFFG